MSSAAQGESPPNSGLSHRTVAAVRHVALRGAAIVYLVVLVALPTIAVITKGFGDGLAAFAHAMDVPGAWAAIRLTLVMAAVVALTNAVAGTALAWALVRYAFPGRRAVTIAVDLPLAIPTLVWGG